MSRILSRWPMLALALLAGPALSSPITSASDPALAGAAVYGFDEGTGLTPGLASVELPGLGRMVDPYGAHFYLGPAVNYFAARSLYTGSSTAVRYDFDVALSAFGFGWFAIDYVVRLEAFDGAGLLLETVMIARQDPNSAHFSGVAVGGIRSVLATALGPQGQPGYVDNYIIDNLTYVRDDSPIVGEVPEPATLALAVTALAGLACTRHRRSITVPPTHQEAP